MDFIEYKLTYFRLLLWDNLRELMIIIYWLVIKLSWLCPRNTWEEKLISSLLAKSRPLLDFSLIEEGIIFQFPKFNLLNRCIILPLNQQTSWRIIASLQLEPFYPTPLFFLFFLLWDLMEQIYKSWHWSAGSFSYEMYQYLFPSIVLSDDHRAGIYQESRDLHCRFLLSFQTPFLPVWLT